jgi:cyclin A
MNQLNNYFMSNQGLIQDENAFQSHSNQHLPNKQPIQQRNVQVTKTAPFYDAFPQQHVTKQSNQVMKQQQPQQYHHFSNNSRPVLQDLTNNNKRTHNHLIGPTPSYVFGSKPGGTDQKQVNSIEQFSVFSYNNSFSSTNGTNQRSQFIVKNGQFIPTNNTSLLTQQITTQPQQQQVVSAPSFVQSKKPTQETDMEEDNEDNSIDIDEEEDQDIDEEIGNNEPQPIDYDPAQDCIDYAQDIYLHLRNTEKRYKANPNYMRDRQVDINPSMRGILIDWLNEVCQEYKLKLETLYLAVNITDRALTKFQIQRNKLQEVGITALFIASKYNELTPPTVDDFVYITENTYPKSEILAMESLILNALEFNLTVVTSYHFLVKFLKAVKATDLCVDMTFYLTELTLQDYRLIAFLPSAVAASAVTIALHTLGFNCWPESLRKVSGYSKSDLKDCIEEIMRIYRDTATSNLAAVKTKYSRSQYNRASMVPLPTSSPPI